MKTYELEMKLRELILDYNDAHGVMVDNVRVDYGLVGGVQRSQITIQMHSI